MAEQTAIPRARDGAPATQAASHPDSYQGVSPIKANKLGHLVYEVSDVERTARFWTEVMGLIETGRPRPPEQFHRVKSLEDAIANPLAKTW